MKFEGEFEFGAEPRSESTPCSARSEALTSDAYVVSVAVPRPLDGAFSYRVPRGLETQLKVGGWVRVPFGRSETHAFIVEEPEKESVFRARVGQEIALKDLIEVGSSESVFPKDIWELCKWAHRYYRAPLGETLACAAPPASLGIRSVRRQSRELESKRTEPFRLPLNSAQSAAVDAITAAGSTPCLLHGVTGSGKTEVYLEVARRALAAGKGVLILVPEIALTPQLHERFERGLGEGVGLWHSALSDGRRRDLAGALRSGALRAVVGARSAVFAPLVDLGLVVVDEEHDATYKQEDRVRYHARDLALVRAKLTGAQVVLGSATPSLESLENVRSGKYIKASLPERATGGALPSVEVVDLTEQPHVEGIRSVIAQSTLEALRATVASGRQAMVFLNKRGYAAFLLCEECGEVRGCPDCSISLTYHKARAKLVCHVCGFQERPPATCSKCNGNQLSPMGAGTESLEEELAALLPEARLARLDRDQITSTSRLEAVLSDFRERRADILLGTQMLVKGHDFPGVTLVVVILADALFRWPDFRAPERALQILTQVSGRAGRRDDPGKVLIQAYDRDHPVLRVLTGQLSETEFLESERSLREALGYPPFGRLARIRLEDRDSKLAHTRAEALAAEVRGIRSTHPVDVLGPSEAFLERVRGICRWDFLLRSRDVGALQAAVGAVRASARRRDRDWPVVVDVDPVGA